MSRWSAVIGPAILTAQFIVFDIAFYLAPGLAHAGIDARIYLAATRAWLSGGDPWAVPVFGVVFAGPPLTLLPLAPFAWLPDDAFVVLMIAGSIAAMIFAVRRLHLPLWWVLFPPAFEAIVSGNPNVIVLAAMVAGVGWLAAILKVYVALPLVLLGRWRELAIAAVIVLVTLPVLPWATFLGSDVSEILAQQSGGGRSAWGMPWPMLPIAVIALIVIGRKRAAWWIVPVLWPATQFHYNLLALPALSLPAAFVLAIPLPLFPVYALVSEAGLVLLRYAVAADRTRRDVAGALDEADRADRRGALVHTQHG